MTKVFVFGYGSLMNEQSLQKTLPGKKIWGKAVLKGWRRAFNKPGNAHCYLNIIPATLKDKIKQTEGVLVAVNANELEALKLREPGYEVVDVTKQIVSSPKDAKVVAFAAPSLLACPCKNLPIRGSYLEKVLKGVPAGKRKKWFEETDFASADIDKNS